MIPHSLSKVQLKRFKLWLECSGAELLHEKSRRNLLTARIKGSAFSLKIIRGTLIWPRALATAYHCFSEGHPWSGSERNNANYNAQALIRAIVERDGANCFFCQKPVPRSDRTVEHLVPRAHGGPNHLSNLFLAHKDCNNAAGSLPATQKIEIREKNHA